MPGSEILWAMGGFSTFVTLLSAAAAMRHGTKLHPFRERMAGQVTLLLAVTGPVPQIEVLFRALAAQSFPARRLIVAVEALDDPAVALTPPLGSIVILVLMIQALPGQELTWRHVTYAIAGPDQLRVVRRKVPGGP